MQRSLAAVQSAREQAEAKLRDSSSAASAAAVRSESALESAKLQLQQQLDWFSAAERQWAEERSALADTARALQRQIAAADELQLRNNELEQQIERSKQTQRRKRAQQQLSAKRRQASWRSCESSWLPLRSKHMRCSCASLPLSRRCTLSVDWLVEARVTAVAMAVAPPLPPPAPRRSCAR